MITNEEMKNPAEFVRQCAELGNKITEMLFGYPKPVAICVLPGVLAAVAKTFDIPRDVFVAMLDSALEDIGPSMIVGR